MIAWLSVVLAACLASAGVLPVALARHASTSSKVAPPRCLAIGRAEPHGGMAWVPTGDFAEGDTVYPEEGPIGPAHVRGFWMDRHEVTNAQFAAFVAATGHITDAERPVDPTRHPELSGDMLKPGALVFFMPRQLGVMEDVSQWWRYVPGANWRHPAGPGSTIIGKDAFPVVEVTHADAQAYARWAHRSLPTEAEWGMGRARW